jgi:hypothetical protein
MFVSFVMTAQTQTEFKVEELYIDNDNKLYYQDIVAEYGLYTATDANSSLSDGFITSLYSGYFLTHWFGIRPGVSVIMDLNNNAPYLKIPCLFAVRSPIVRTTITEPENFREFLFNFFLYILPSRYEFNIGPSLGYVWNSRRHLASSIDMNLRMGFQIWRIGIHGNMGFNYLWTKNFIDRNRIATEARQAWYVNLSIGVSFRF